MPKHRLVPVFAGLASALLLTGAAVSQDNSGVSPGNEVSDPLRADDVAPQEDRTHEAYFDAVKSSADVDFSKGNPDEVFVVRTSELEGDAEATELEAMALDSAVRDRLVEEAMRINQIATLLGQLGLTDIAAATVKDDGKIIIYVNDSDE